MSGRWVPGESWSLGHVVWQWAHIWRGWSVYRVGVKEAGAGLSRGDRWVAEALGRGDHWRRMSLGISHRHLPSWKESGITPTFQKESSNSG